MTDNQSTGIAIDRVAVIGHPSFLQSGPERTHIPVGIGSVPSSALVEQPVCYRSKEISMAH